MAAPMAKAGRAVSEKNSRQDQRPKRCLSEEPEDADTLERRHFRKIVAAFKGYRGHSLRMLAKWERSYNTLPEGHKKLIPDYRRHLDDINACIEHNHSIISHMIKDADHMFVNADHSQDQGYEFTAQPSDMDLDKVRSTLRQFARDWSAEGELERLQCYQPVIDDIEKRFPPDEGDPSEVQILVPGAGLGRLTFELARRGYACQGNEWSLFMLFASNFILNCCHQVNALCLYPWIHQSCNNRTNADRVRPVYFPDVNPSSLPKGAEFSMAAGDFLEIYQENNSWDCVATVFFIDTAHNVIAYIETIYKILKPGGYWCNLGPLLYHYADIKGEPSIELSYEDIRDVIVKVGFVFQKEEQSVKSGYTQNARSMLKYEYDSVYFVCRKPPENASDVKDNGDNSDSGDMSDSEDFNETEITNSHDSENAPVNLKLDQNSIEDSVENSIEDSTDENR